MLDASIRENIAMGINDKNINQQKIDELIKFTNLENVINNLPEKVIQMWGIWVIIFLVVKNKELE